MFVVAGEAERVRTLGIAAFLPSLPGWAACPRPTSIRDSPRADWSGRLPTASSGNRLRVSFSNQPAADSDWDRVKGQLVAEHEGWLALPPVTATRRPRLAMGVGVMWDDESINRRPRVRYWGAADRGLPSPLVVDRNVASVFRAMGLDSRTGGRSAALCHPFTAATGSTSVGQ